MTIDEFKALIAGRADMQRMNQIAAFLSSVSTEECKQYTCLREFSAFAVANSDVVHEWSRRRLSFQNIMRLGAVPEDLRDLYLMIESCEGAEIHVNDWPAAERLVASGHITLGPARGPGHTFKRATLKGE